MKTRLSKYFSFLMTILVYTVLVFASTAAATSSGSSGASSLQHGTIKPASSSFNWSGYVATGQTFNRVQSIITVPTVSCTVPGAQSLFWVGLDGYSTSANQTVEQDGVGAKCSGGKHPTLHYFGWWEMFQTNQSTSLQPIPTSVIAIKPGDRVKAVVTYNPSNQGYTLQLNNLSTKQLFATTQYCTGNACSRHSAEWIAERYMLASNTYTALAKWQAGPSLFAASSASADHTATLQPISHFNYKPINMMSQQTFGTIDTTSPLYYGGNAFTVNWKAAN